MSQHEAAPSGAAQEVVVGIDGSPAGVSALRYALGEADRLGGAVRVIHAIQTYVGMTPRYPLPLDAMTAAGREVLRSALTKAGPVPATVRVATTLARGGAVQELTSARKAARVVVVGSDRRPLAARLLTGNVSTGVAASAGVPVVAVPETWRSPAPTGGVLVVGIKSADHAHGVLSEAFPLAQERGARLRVMHAWQLPGGYDDMIAQHAAHDWDARACDELDRAVGTWRAAYPDVDVELRTVHDQAAHALVGASVDADELVLARRSHRAPSARHLGSTARAVMAHAHCPVRVVPAELRSPSAERLLKDAGALAT